MPRLCYTFSLPFARSIAAERGDRGPPGPGFGGQNKGSGAAALLGGQAWCLRLAAAAAPGEVAAVAAAGRICVCECMEKNVRGGRKT